MTQARFDAYCTNEDLLARLSALAEAHPTILRLETLGESWEKRPIPVVVVTNQATGSDLEKPGFWIDANIHATEVTGTMAALYFLDRLTRLYGEDPKVTRIVDEQVCYVVPRLNMDGAAAALGKPPRWLRSGTRPYPFPDRRDGLHKEDIDGDGRILQMRIEDPTGDWKVSPHDPCLLIKRGPDEEGGTYYRLFDEGRIEGWDGHTIKAAPAYHGLDFNRNFPGSWRPEGVQRGAGDHPGSEPEIRHVMEWFAKHPNIFGAIAYHTFSRAILRPYGGRADDDMETDDLRVYEAIGRRGTELTGYPCVSVYHHFKYHPKEVITGVFDDWLYDHKGIFAFTIELWDLASAAGVEHKNKDKKFIEWFRDHPPEDDERMAAWAREHAPGALVEWYPFEHPQLGRVELGGWNVMYAFTNPPTALLEAEIAPQADFAVAFASLAPRLRWRTVEARPLGEGRFHVLAVCENTGFLPTAASRQATKVKACREVRLEIGLPPGASLVGGKPRVDVGHLEGRSNKLSACSLWTSSDTDNRGRAEWIVDAPAGGPLTITARSERAGVLRHQVALTEVSDR